MKQKIVIRADGGTSIGMGHVIRCLALGDMLKNDFSIVFAIQQPAESVIKNIHTVTKAILSLPLTTDYREDAGNFTGFLDAADIVVLDGYNFKTEYQQKIKDKGCKLVAIDDLHSWHHVADAIINQAPAFDNTLYSRENYTRLYSGADYALLRSPFLIPAPSNIIKELKKVFISMGASDINNLTEKFGRAAADVKGIEEIHLMLGSVNPNLKSIDTFIEDNSHIRIIKHFDIFAEELAALLKECDLAICPASSISIECCAIGTGLVCGYTADNQKGILEGLVKHNAIVNLGDLNKIEVKDIRIKLMQLVKDPQQFNPMIKNQKKMIDGRSPERLRNIFKQLATQKLHFRAAKISDADQYFKWTNDADVRMFSYKQSPVTYEDHIKWFTAKLESADCFFYLFLNEEDQAVGQVRIDNSGNETVIGISIDEAFRGKGLAAEMLKMASADYLHKHASSIITAYIKTENISSYRSFKKAGFSDEEYVIEHGVKSYKLYKKLNSQ